MRCLGGGVKANTVGVRQWDVEAEQGKKRRRQEAFVRTHTTVLIF